MIIQTAQDLFWLLFGISVVLFTLFICWAMFYFVMMLKDIRAITRNVREKMKLVEEFITLAKEKLTDTSRYLKVIVDTVVKLTGWLASKQEVENIIEEESKKKTTKK